jgi:hypothetical protein
MISAENEGGFSMRGHNDWVKRILLIAGIVEIVVGLSHFGMPHFAYQSKEFGLLNQDEINFVTLIVFAVGILLTAFGAVTVLISSKMEALKEILFSYALIKSILWLARIILELVYPVKIGLFWIAMPTNVIMPLLIIEWLLFVVSAVLIAVAYRGKAVPLTNR